MEQLPTCEIPDDVRSLEFYDDSTKMEKFKANTQEARTNEKAYITSFTAMIAMDEAASSKRLLSYDLENVQLHLFSRSDQVFQIEFDVSIVYNTLYQIH